LFVKTFVAKAACRLRGVVRLEVTLDVGGPHRGRGARLERLLRAGDPHGRGGERDQEQERSHCDEAADVPHRAGNVVAKNDPRPARCGARPVHTDLAPATRPVRRLARLGSS
jgi:hypothetical protein